MMGFMEIKACWLRILEVHVKGCYLLASQEKGTKTMGVATDRLWRRIRQVGGWGGKAGCTIGDEWRRGSLVTRTAL